MASVKVMILHAPGTNRDGDLAEAVIRAGGEPTILPLSLLRQEKVEASSYGMLALPGGFSYGDALGAGRLFALDLQTWFGDFMQRFIESGRPVIGICNGFQALVKAGYLPEGGLQATLTDNASGHFECRWVRLQANPANPSPWLEGLDTILCPVAHGEGRFVLGKKQVLPSDQIALRYVDANGDPAKGHYPINPNGSMADIAGITNPAGNVLGLMPHPEDHIHSYQHPRWQRTENGWMGLKLIENGLRMAQF
jgi:phosphoribosylformylglycinamidine synthase I